MDKYIKTLHQLKFKTNHLKLEELYEKVKGRGLFSSVIWDYFNNKKELKP